MLSQHFVHSVSAGRNHAAALGGPLNTATGKAAEGSENTVILTWGRGRDGQLGCGLAADSAAPRIVEELRGRRVLQVGRPCRTSYHSVRVLMYLGRDSV